MERQRSRLLAHVGSILTDEQRERIVTALSDLSDAARTAGLRNGNRPYAESLETLSRSLDTDAQALRGLQ